jgi:hypothetical protein
LLARLGENYGRTNSGERESGRLQSLLTHRSARRRTGPQAPLREDLLDNRLFRSAATIFRSPPQFGQCFRSSFDHASLNNFVCALQDGLRDR